MYATILRKRITNRDSSFAFVVFIVSTSICRARRFLPLLRTIGRRASISLSTSIPGPTRPLMYAIKCLSRSPSLPLPRLSTLRGVGEIYGWTRGKMNKANVDEARSLGRYHAAAAGSRELRDRVLRKGALLPRLLRAMCNARGVARPGEGDAGSSGFALARSRGKKYRPPRTQTGRTFPLFVITARQERGLARARVA